MGEPCAALFVADREPHGTLIGHVARANPHWQAARGIDSIAIFHGPHAYVSPSWYRDPVNAVPTWNFAAVHAHGALEIVDDPAEARAVLDALVHRFEGGRAGAVEARRWPTNSATRWWRRSLRFESASSGSTRKFKLSQNRSDEDRVRVIAALKGEDHPEATATAAWMQSYARGRDGPR